MKNSRKGQVQSGETVVVVIIVTIMIVIGLVFATKSKQGSIEQAVEEINEQEAMEVAIIASSLNELRCSDYSTMVKSCLDLHRLYAFSEVVENDKEDSFRHYYDLLGNTKLEVKILTSEPKINITLYDYNNSANKSSSPVFIPTIVFDSITQQSYFAILEVRTFS